MSSEHGTFNAVAKSVDKLEVRWFSVRFDEHGHPQSRHEPVLGSNPGLALASFVYQAHLGRRTLGIDYIINGVSLTDRLNERCTQPYYDTPGCLMNMLPAYWKWRGSDQRGFDLELRRLLGEKLTPATIAPVAQAYHWSQEFVREQFEGSVQVYGCAHCGDRMCGWWGMEIHDEPEHSRVHWSSPDFGRFCFDRLRYREAFAPTRALLSHHRSEQARTDTSVYEMWRAKRAKSR